MSRLVMAVAKFRALLIAAGEMNGTIFQNLMSETKLNVAIDGGYHHCIDAGIIPEVVIGDFDSLDFSLINESVLQINQKKQSQNALKSISTILGDPKGAQHRSNIVKIRYRNPLRCRPRFSTDV